MAHPDRVAEVSKAGDEELVAAYNVPGGRASLQLVLFEAIGVPNKELSLGHFHVELYAPRFFSKLPKSTHRKGALLRTFRELAEKRILARPLALFRAPRSHARLFYSSLGEKVELSPGSAVEMSGAEFVFSKTKLESLDIRVDTDHCIVKVTGRPSAVESLSDDFIVEAFEMLDRAYKEFTEGARP